ncbi:MAG: NACHT domain-containing protein [Bacteroidia bacterium]
MEVKDLSTLFKGPLDKLLNRLGTELEQIVSNRLLEYQAEEFRRNYYSKTILHRAEPKPLNDFYQPLFIREYEKNSGPRISTSSTRKLFSKSKYITIIGSAGSGKSTIIKHLFVTCFKEDYKIPIKIELRYLNDFKGRFHEYIFNEIFTFNKLGSSSTIIDRLLNSGNFVFFFDGYDELNSNIRTQVTKDIDAFVSKYSENDYVITSRPYTSIDLLPLFSNFSVCNLEDGEIAAFVRKQIPLEEKEMASKMIEAINKGENISYKAFLSNPLLLSMFILTFQSYSDIPSNRSEFYNQVFDTLFAVHDSMSKLAYIREKVCALNKSQFEEVLRSFSFLSFFEEKFIFSSNYLVAKFDFIKEKKKDISFDNELFTEDLQVAIGILNKEGLDYTFPHRSLQEYFAASYIEKLGPENKKKMYTKMMVDIRDNFHLALNKDHFHKLLIEIDHINFARHLAIPLLTDILQKLSDLDEIDDDIAFDFYGRLLVFYHFLLKPQSESELKDIVNGAFGYAIINKGDNKFSMSEHEKRGSRNNAEMLDFMIEAVGKFKTKGSVIINSLRKSIDDIDNSDTEIINFI